MLIEFLTEWAVYKTGQVVAWDGAGSADVLIRRGIARPAVVAAPPAEVTSVPPAAKPKKVARR